MSAVEVAFKNVKITITDETIISKIQTFCLEFGLSPDSFALKWEAHVVNNNSSKTATETIDTSPTHKSLDKFKTILGRDQQFIQKSKPHKSRSLDKNSIKDVVGLYGSTDNFESVDMMEEDEVNDKMEEEIFDTELNTNSMNDNNNTEHNSTINDNDGKITWNKELKESLSDEIKNNNKIKIEVNKEFNIDKPYRFMNEKLPSKLEILDDFMEKLSNEIITNNNIEVTKQITNVSQSNVIGVGRIVRETEGKLNDPYPPLLETLLNKSIKSRIRLNLQSNNNNNSNLTCSLFPGQIVAVEGNNPTGSLFNVTRVIEGVSISNNNNNNNNNMGVEVIVGSGPWEKGNNLNNQLEILLKKVNEEKPQVCILIGPFIDGNNKRIETDIKQTFDDYFNSKIVELISKEANKNKDIKYIVIPSIRDVTVDSIFPQSPFIVFPNVVHCLSNPAHFTINDINISITSTDILKHLSAEEYSIHKDKDRLAKLCQHLIQQRCIYPLFPPNATVNVDYNHFKSLQLPVLPDILIVPSDLQKFVKVNKGNVSQYINSQFIKNVCSVLCINPGRCSQGYYAKFVVHPNSNSCKTHERTRVDIVKL